jgi:hypothetical protein
MPNVPDLSQLGKNATAATFGANPAEPDVAPVADGPPCAKCGLPTAHLDEEMQRVLRANPGVTIAHDVCPGSEPAAPSGRYFEVRVQIVEVTEHDEGDGDHPELGREVHHTVEELISFVAGHRAPNLDAAMRPLALALGEKWQKAEKQAAIADSEPS